jgi:hypothetical protein
VEGAITKGRIDHHQSLGIVTNIELVSDTHAAVHLNRFAVDDLAVSVD